MTWQIVSLLVVIFVASAGLVGDLFHHARERQWLVVPGKRSSHQSPTPSGAGVVIVLMVLVGAGALHGLGMIDPSIVITIIVGGGAIALVSWLDDIKGVPARYRLATQFAAALAVLWWIGPLVGLTGGFANLVFGTSIGALLTVLGVIWMSNLVNFMDGTDGLVGTQTIFVSLVIAVALILNGALGPALLLLVLAASTAGFLAWNWHPAKVFLGDVGAVFIGYTFGVLAVWTELNGVMPLLVWSILLSPFIVDATLSTVRRLRRGHPLLEGHREFAFHRAVRRGFSHAQVAVSFILIDLLLLVPAILAQTNPTLLTAMTVLSYIFCASIWWVVQRSDQPFAFIAQASRAPSRRVRVLLFVFADVLIISTALIVSFFLRFDFSLTPSEVQLLLLSIPSFLVVKLLSFWHFRLYRMRWHAVGLHDLYAIIKAAVVSSAALAVVIFFFGQSWFLSFPRSILLIDGTLTFLLIASLRISRRMFFEVMRGKRPRIRPQELGGQTVEDFFAGAGFAVDEERIARLLDSKSVLVTGAAGSIGHELAIHLCRSSARRLIFLDHNEAGLVGLHRELLRRYGKQADRLEVVVADVRDAGRIERIMAAERPDIIFHTAAYKHGRFMEKDVEEAVSVNILGTANVARASVTSGATWFIHLSDIMARSRTSVGMTKGLSEAICLGYAKMAKTKFVCVRIGTVLGSRGGVLSTFLEQIERSGPVTVTDPDVERRMMTVQETTMGILQAFALEKSGLVLLEGGQKMRLRAFAESLVRLHGLEPYNDIEIRVVGSRPGEIVEPRSSKRTATSHPSLFFLQADGKWNAKSAEGIQEKVDQLLQFGAMHHLALVRLFEEYVLRRDDQPDLLAIEENESIQTSRPPENDVN